MLQHCLERTLPTFAKCRNPQGALQLLAGMSGQIQEGVNLGHTDSLWTVSDFYNVVARPDFTFLQDAKRRIPVCDALQAGLAYGLVHADADAVARHAWLRHFKFSTANAVSVANVHLIIRKIPLR